jgi:hypothetical protein
VKAPRAENNDEQERAREKPEIAAESLLLFKVAKLARRFRA